jgi:hypothetical protein
MKSFLIVVVGSVLFSTFLVWSFGKCFPKKTYKVEIEFCDKRPSIITTVQSRFYPNNRQILSGRRAVTVYEDYLNVCNVKVVK